jgi:NADPH-dependent 2,4-dienoyl-CoA reductase/sulfur reductase-like enzyme
VVVGIGVNPQTEWLEGSGLNIENGVVCDQSLFAADGVMAAGDVARWWWRHDTTEELVRIEHWELAAQGGMFAARNLLAGREAAEAFTPVPYFWSDQFGVRIQMLGRPAPTDEVVVVDGALDEEKFVVLYGRAGRLVATLSIGKPRQLMAFRPLLDKGTSFAEALKVLSA